MIGSDDVRAALQDTTDDVEQQIVVLLNEQGGESISIRALLALTKSAVENTGGQEQMADLKRELLEERQLTRQLRTQLEQEMQCQKGVVDVSMNFDALQEEYELEQQMLDDLGTPTDTPCDTPVARSRSTSSAQLQEEPPSQDPALINALQNIQTGSRGKKSLSLRSTLSSWFNNTPAADGAQELSFEDNLAAFYK
jgi:hypothetical protein